MKKFDYKHAAFHVLIALYFIWALVFMVLIGMAVITVSGTAASAELVSMLMIWIFFNLIIGTALFLVIRLFRNRSLVNKVVFYVYFVLASLSVATVLYIRQGV